jgi:hypothetical protein
VAGQPAAVVGRRILPALHAFAGETGARGGAMALLFATELMIAR